MRDNSCVLAYFAFVARLRERKNHYESNYGFIPQFKAGLNLGSVTVAEVGEIKREIAYHGDTINTAARIQAKCNEYQCDLLASERLVKQLQPENQLIFEEKGRSYSGESQKK